MGVNYADIKYRDAWLSTDFGRDYAMKIFNLAESDLEKLVGRYTKGKRKGLLKGKIVWSHAVKGGWVKTGRYDCDMMRASGFVVRPNKRFGHQIIVPLWNGEATVILSH